MGSVTGYREVFTNSEQRAGFDVDSGRAAFHRRGRDEKKRSCDSKTFVEQHGAKQRYEAFGSIFQQQGAV